jgi:hypothetical protein
MSRSHPVTGHKDACSDCAGQAADNRVVSDQSVDDFDSRMCFQLFICVGNRVRRIQFEAASKAKLAMQTEEGADMFVSSAVVWNLTKQACPVSARPSPCRCSNCKSAFTVCSFPWRSCKPSPATLDGGISAQEGCCTLCISSELAHRRIGHRGCHHGQTSRGILRSCE